MSYLFTLAAVAGGAAAAAALGYVVGARSNKEQSVSVESSSSLEQGSVRDRLFELSMDMMTACTFDGYPITINPKFERVLGWTMEDLRGKQVLEFVHPEDREVTAAEFARLATGSNFILDFQNRIRCKSGVYKKVAWRTATDPERGVLYTVARDMTDDEQLFKTFVENSSAVVWMEDPLTQRIVFVSPAYEEVFGRTCISLYENGRDWVDAILPEDRGEVEEQLHNRPSGEPFLAEFRIRRPDGSIRWVRDQGFPVHDANGQLTRIVGIAEDITEKRQAEQALRHRERLASIGTLAAGIAHDINNPLGAILLAAESALSRTSDKETVERALRDVVLETSRCGRIVDSVLRFARDETLEKRDLDLNDLVRHAVELFRNHGQEQGVVVGLQLCDDLPALKLNETEIELAVLNILQNASEAGAKRVAVYSEANGESVKLAVDDDGVGILDTDAPHVFEPFYTTRRGRGGSGLGLSITHGIVADHGGRISLVPKTEGGTRIAIELPTSTISGRAENSYG